MNNAPPPPCRPEESPTKDLGRGRPRPRQATTSPCRPEESPTKDLGRGRPRPRQATTSPCRPEESPTKDLGRGRPRPRQATTPPCRPEESSTKDLARAVLELAGVSTSPSPQVPSLYSGNHLVGMWRRRCRPEESSTKDLVRGRPRPRQAPPPPCRPEESSTKDLGRGRPRPRQAPPPPCRPEESSTKDLARAVLELAGVSTSPSPQVPSLYSGNHLAGMWRRRCRPEESSTKDLGRGPLDHAKRLRHSLVSSKLHNSVQRTPGRDRPVPHPRPPHDPVSPNRPQLTAVRAMRPVVPQQ